MSFRDDPFHLHDILEGIARIESFVEGMNFEAYKQDVKTRSAVERQLQIITEAAYRLGDRAEQICPGPDWKGYRGMGNVLRHSYDRISDRVVWDTVMVDLPYLKQAVTHALQRLVPQQAE